MLNNEIVLTILKAASKVIKVIKKEIQPKEEKKSCSG